MSSYEETKKNQQMGGRERKLQISRFIKTPSKLPHKIFSPLAREDTGSGLVPGFNLGLLKQFCAFRVLENLVVDAKVERERGGGREGKG